MTEFSAGQSVQLYATIPSRSGGSVDAGTRGVVREIDLARPDGDIYRVAFLSSGQLTGEEAWLRAVDLLAA